MNKLLLSTLLLGAAICVAGPARAQSFTGALPSGGLADTSSQGWAGVQALAPNTALHIKARTHNAHCRLQSADTDTLTCLTGAKAETYQRSDILSIKVPHRTRSTIVGLAAGAGVGAIIGAAAGKTDGIIGRGAFAAILAIPLGLIGGLVGAATDFTSATVYRQ